MAKKNVTNTNNGPTPDFISAEQKQREQDIQNDAELSRRISPATQTFGDKNPNLLSDYDYQTNMESKNQYNPQPNPASTNPNLKVETPMKQAVNAEGADKIKVSMKQPLNTMQTDHIPMDHSAGFSDSPDAMNNVFYEHGITGLTRFGGFVYEEWLKELQGRRGALTYREMRDNDAIIGAFLYAIEMIIRSVKWHVVEAGQTQEDLIAKDFMTSVFDDMDISWNDTISEILTFLPYGWCMMELCYKKRIGPDEPTGLTKSKYSDGRIGWKKWGIRAQETLWRWRFELDGSIVGMEQIAPPDYKMRFIPIEKALLFRTRSNRNNPEGRSLLRNCYRSWYFKKNIEEVEAIGIERDLAGFPIMWLPPEVMSGGMPGASPELAAAYNYYKKMVVNIKRHEQEGILMPLVHNEKGEKIYDLTLLASGASRRQFDTNQIIQRYEQRIAMTVLADFLMLGHEKTGSFALSVDKTGMFQLAIAAILDIIADTINSYAIPRLMGLNTFTNLTDYPKIAYTPIEKANLSSLATFIKETSAAGALTFGDIETENYLREAANLPKKVQSIKDDTMIATDNTIDGYFTPPPLANLFTDNNVNQNGGNNMFNNQIPQTPPINPVAATIEPPPPTPEEAAVQAAQAGATPPAGAQATPPAGAQATPPAGAQATPPAVEQLPSAQAKPESGAITPSPNASPIETSVPQIENQSAGEPNSISSGAPKEESTPKQKQKQLSLKERWALESQESTPTEETTPAEQTPPLKTKKKPMSLSDRWAADSSGSEPPFTFLK